MTSSASSGDSKHAGSRSSSRMTMTIPEVIQAEVMLPADKCGLVVGKNGETIRRLQASFVLR